jgi:deoxyhypusine synthase
MAKKILKKPTVPVKVGNDKKVSELIKEMLLTGFQGKKLSEVAEVWSRMLQENEIVIWLGLAGAMVPVGMKNIIIFLIKKRLIDVIVTTGANIYHDLFEAMGGRHFIGNHLADDVELRKKRIDRIYDIFASEDGLFELDKWIRDKFCPLLKDDYRYSSREILQMLGNVVTERRSNTESILSTSYLHGIPIFSPALCDSALGFSIMFANRSKNRNIILDSLKDVDESSLITEKTKKSGVIYVGGGIPKNFIQQTAVIASYQTGNDMSHEYAIQITTDMPMWGGLSGCTLEEGQSWGKIKSEADKTTCYADATIVLPIIAQAMSERHKKLSRKIPVFEWTEEKFQLRYEKKRMI